MGQLLVRQLDELTIGKLRVAAKARKTSVEALARDAIRQAAQLSVDEKLAIALEAQAITGRAKVSGAVQTPGWALIREDRDR